MRGLWSCGYSGGRGRASIGNHEIDFTAGVGLGGQRLYVVPTQHLVVVVTAGLYDRPLQGLGGGTVLNQFVLPSALPQ